MCLRVPLKLMILSWALASIILLVLLLPYASPLEQCYLSLLERTTLIISNIVCCKCVGFCSYSQSNISASFLALKHLIFTCIFQSVRGQASWPWTSISFLCTINIRLNAHFFSCFPIPSWCHSTHWLILCCKSQAWCVLFCFFIFGFTILVFPRLSETFGHLSWLPYHPSVLHTSLFDVF